MAVKRADLETLRSECHADGRHALAMSCSVLLYPHRYGETTVAMATVDVERAWAARSAPQHIDEQPTVPRVQTRETQPMRTPTDEEIVAEIAERKGAQ